MTLNISEDQSLNASVPLVPITRHTKPTQLGWLATLLVYWVTSIAFAIQYLYTKSFIFPPGSILLAPVAPQFPHIIYLQGSTISPVGPVIEIAHYQKHVFI